MILFKYTDVFVTHNGDVTYEKIVNKKNQKKRNDTLQRFTYLQKLNITPKTLVAATYRSEIKNTTQTNTHIKI